MPTSDFTGATLPDGDEPASAWYIHLAEYDETIAVNIQRQFNDLAALNTAIPTPVVGQVARLISPFQVVRWNGTEWETVFPAAIDTVQSAAAIRGVGALAATPGDHKMLNLDGSIYTAGQPFGTNTPYVLMLRGGVQFYGNSSNSRAEVRLLMREGGGWTEIYKRTTGDKAASSGDVDVVLDTHLIATGSAALELDLITTVAGAAVNWYAGTFTLTAVRMRG